MTRHGGAVVLARRPWDEGLVADVQQLRRDAEARHTEVDLLVATLRDHVRDLRIERERLRAEIARLRDDARRESSHWLWRGAKPNR